MFSTILRQEARLTLRPLLIGLGMVALIYLVSLGLAALNWPVVSDLAQMVALLCAVAIPAGASIYLLVHYYRSMYGRVGYFTMTLPVRGRTLYAAKAVYAFAVILVATVIAIPAGVGLFAVQNAVRGISVGDFLKPYLTGMANHPVVTAVWVVAGLFLVAFTVVQYAFYVTVGSEARFASLGMGGPVVVYVIGYVVLQILTLVGMIAIPIGLTLGEQNTFTGVNVWRMINDGGSTQEIVPIGFAPVMLVAMVVLVIWTIRSIERRTSLR